MILNVDFALNISNFTSLKCFMCLKWILENLSTILHSQFNYHTLPVTPFNLDEFNELPLCFQVILLCIEGHVLFTTVFNPFIWSKNWKRSSFSYLEKCLILMLSSIVSVSPNTQVIWHSINGDWGFIWNYFFTLQSLKATFPYEGF